MAYKMKVQISDTVLEFDTKAKRDVAVTATVVALQKLSIPNDSIFVTPFDTQVSSFTGNEERKPGKVKPDRSAV